MKQLQFVLPAGKERPSEYLVGAGREKRRHPGSVRLSVQIKLSLEREAMRMCRQLVGAISATRSHGEEGLELRRDSVDVLHSLAP